MISLKLFLEDTPSRIVHKTEGKEKWLKDRSKKRTHPHTNTHTHSLSLWRTDKVEGQRSEHDWQMDSGGSEREGSTPCTSPSFLVELLVLQYESKSHRYVFQQQKNPKKQNQKNIKSANTHERDQPGIIMSTYHIIINHSNSTESHPKWHFTKQVKKHTTEQRPR